MPVRATGNRIYVSEQEEKKKRSYKEKREQEWSPDDGFLLLQVHEPRPDEADFERRDCEADCHVYRSSVDADFVKRPDKDADFVEVEVRQCDRNSRKKEEQEPNYEIHLYMSEHASMCGVVAV